MESKSIKVIDTQPLYLIINKLRCVFLSLKSGILESRDLENRKKRLNFALQNLKKWLKI